MLTSYWLNIEKNEPEMFTVNKIYGKYQTGNDLFRIKKKKERYRQKSERRSRRTRHQFGVALRNFLVMNMYNNKIPVTADRIQKAHLSTYLNKLSLGFLWKLLKGCQFNLNKANYRFKALLHIITSLMI